MTPSNIPPEGMQVAEKVLDHLRTMYPDALKAVPASASISLRNFTVAAVNAAILAEREGCAEEVNGVDEHILAPMSEGAVSVYCRSRVDAAAAIRNRSTITARD